jgi:thiol-disulfide isomerase/thioredoxin
MSTRPAPRRVAAGVAGVLAAVALASGCSAAGTASAAGAGVADPGYVSGDGTVTQWEASRRGTPVELAGRSFEGEDLDLAAWRGDVVVVNFWYAACPPCRAEAPDLVALSNDYAEEGVRVVGINSTDEAGTAQAFQRTFGIPYPSIDDREGRGISAMQGAVPLRAVPTTVVLDPEGRIAARVLGRAEGSSLRALVDDALAEVAA